MTTHQLSQPSPSLVTRVLDTVDRAHAKAAMKLHGARSSVRTTLEHALDRTEQLMTTGIGRARKSLQRADVVSADLVNRAQGVVGQTIEKARVARSRPEHLAS
jgi:hypothetical protein